MKNHSVFTVVLLLSLALAGCNDEDDTAQPKQQRSAEVDRLNRELQKAETNVSKQESAKTWWQSVATLCLQALADSCLETSVSAFCSSRLSRSTSADSRPLD